MKITPVHKKNFVIIPSCIAQPFIRELENQGITIYEKERMHMDKMWYEKFYPDFECILSNKKIYFTPCRIVMNANWYEVYELAKEMAKEIAKHISYMPEEKPVSIQDLKEANQSFNENEYAQHVFKDFLRMNAASYLKYWFLQGRNRLVGIPVMGSTFSKEKAIEKALERYKKRMETYDSWIAYKYPDGLESITILDILDFALQEGEDSEIYRERNEIDYAKEAAFHTNHLIEVFLLDALEEIQEPKGSPWTLQVRQEKPRLSLQNLKGSMITDLSSIRSILKEVKQIKYASICNPYDYDDLYRQCGNNDDKTFESATLQKIASLVRYSYHQNEDLLEKTGFAFRPFITFAQIVI